MLVRPESEVYQFMARTNNLRRDEMSSINFCTGILHIYHSCVGCTGKRTICMLMHGSSRSKCSRRRSCFAAPQLRAHGSRRPFSTGVRRRRRPWLLPSVPRQWRASPRLASLSLPCPAAAFCGLTTTASPSMLVTTVKQGTLLLSIRSLMHCICRSKVARNKSDVVHIQCRCQMVLTIILFNFPPAGVAVAARASSK